MNNKGTTLLETVLYIGIVMIVLPTFVMFLINLWQTYTLLDARSRIEQTASVVFLELQNSLTEADAISISTSTLANDSGVLKFLDATGQLVTIDRPTVAVTLVGAPQNVRRLRMQKGTNPATYLTDPEIDVTQWRIEAIRTDATLSGLRISYDMAMLNPGIGAYRHSAFSADTTFALSGHTIEN
ncbi:MAG: hypothetical protein WC813_02650 [Patescibacteria group bacterium]|jgi:hypothetical protein